MANTDRRNGELLMLIVLVLAFGGLGLFGVIGSTLLPAMRVLFGLGFSAALAVQWVPLVGGGIFALPMGGVMARLGPVRTMQAGLALSLAGCLSLAGVAQATISGAGNYLGILAGLFVLSAGSTALQVAINPMMLNIGDPAAGPSRLLLAQAVNSLGVWSGVRLSSWLVLGSAPGPSSPASAMAGGLAQTYLFCAIALAVVLLLAVAVFRSGPSLAGDANPKRSADAGPRAWQCPWALAGALAIALYVGAEGAIGALLVSYLNQPEVLGLTLAVAGVWLANGYWGGAALSRLGGAAVLRRMPASLVLGAAAALAMVCCFVALVGHGLSAGVAAVSTGLCNGVMFPLIFAVTLKQTRASAARVSALLVFAISGGALVSLVTGWVAENGGLAKAFSVPLLGYAFIFGFALAAGLRTTRRSAAAGLPDGE